MCLTAFQHPQRALYSRRFVTVVLVKRDDHHKAQCEIQCREGVLRGRKLYSPKKGQIGSDNLEMRAANVEVRGFVSYTCPYI